MSHGVSSIGIESENAASQEGSIHPHATLSLLQQMPHSTDKLLRIVTTAVHNISVLLADFSLTQEKPAHAEPQSVGIVEQDRQVQSSAVLLEQKMMLETLKGQLETFTQEQQLLEQYTLFTQNLDIRNQSNFLLSSLSNFKTLKFLTNSIGQYVSSMTRSSPVSILAEQLSRDLHAHILAMASIVLKDTYPNVRGVNICQWQEICEMVSIVQDGMLEQSQQGACTLVQCLDNHRTMNSIAIKVLRFLQHICSYYYDWIMNILSIKHGLSGTVMQLDSLLFTLMNNQCASESDTEVSAILEEGKACLGYYHRLDDSLDVSSSCMQTMCSLIKQESLNCLLTEESISASEVSLGACAIQDLMQPVDLPSLILIDQLNAILRCVKSANIMPDSLVLQSLCCSSTSDFKHTIESMLGKIYHNWQHSSLQDQACMAEFIAYFERDPFSCPIRNLAEHGGHYTNMIAAVMQAYHMELDQHNKLLFLEESSEVNLCTVKSSQDQGLRIIFQLGMLACDYKMLSFLGERTLYVLINSTHLLMENSTDEHVKRTLRQLEIALFYETQSC